MKKIIIFGAGGLAREVAFLIEDINKASPTWDILGFVDNDKDLIGSQVGKYPVICSEDDLINMEVAAVIGIGNPSIIRRIATSFTNHPGLSFPNLIHPDTVWDHKMIEIGEGNIICAGNVFTTDIHIGSFNIFNLSCTYGHDIRINDYCVFNPGVNISGGVNIGSQCLVGTGATILQNRNIGEGATVGAGAVVTKDVQPSVTVVGIPAKPL